MGARDVGCWPGLHSTPREKKDIKALVAANSQLVETCESCHKQYKPSIPSEGIVHRHMHLEKR